MQKQEFVKLCKEKYGDFFDYTYLPEFIKRTTECIVCKKHGEVWMIPRDHLRTKYGCPRCANEKMTLTDYEQNKRNLDKADKKYKGRYDYSDVDLEKGKRDAVLIGCPDHGQFLMSLRSHLYTIYGCPECAKEKSIQGRRKYSSLEKDVIPACRKVHGERYEYIDYDLESLMLTYLCTKHGERVQQLNSHLSGRGCNVCRYTDRTITPDEFLERVRTVHPSGYTYKLSELRTVNDKITITHDCGRVYKGRVSNHLDGQGCSRCRTSLGETKVRMFLQLNNIEFIDQYTIEGYPYRYDFYLPDMDILIEYDGEQHFRPIEYFGGEKTFKLRQRLDRRKTKLAKEKGYVLIRIPYTEYQTLEDVLSRAFDKLFNYRVNGVFYRNIDALRNSKKWSEETTSEYIEHLRTFKVLESLPG